MTPEARIAAAIELIDEITTSAAQNAAPADVIVRRFFKARRYAGSGDRRAVIERVYAALRNWQELSWRLGKVGAVVSGRNIVLAQLTGEGADPGSLFTGQGHAPDALGETDSEFVETLKEKTDPAPEFAQLNCPKWIFDQARERFGETTSEELTALNSRARPDLRVNLLKSDRASILESFAREDIEAAPTPLSSVGIRLASHVNLTNHSAMKSGLIEVQDESAQIASLISGASEKMQVVDLCAGAGGKTLAMAAAMGNSGQIYAFDISRQKLAELEKRAGRAGVRNVQIDRLPAMGDKRGRRLRRLHERADLVILDVPCSGSGTWRRNPDLRLRLTPDGLNDLIDQQEALLREGAGMVKPGGRLVYMTCSFLIAENEAPVSRFLEENDEWRVVAWNAGGTAGDGIDLASGPVSIPGALQLTPLAHGTDAFFVIVLEYSHS